MLAQHASVDEVESVSCHQLAVALDAGETLEVVDVALGTHHVVAGRNHLAAAAARTARPEQLDVVMLAENHAGLCEAGAADVCEGRLAARALEACVVPVSVQRMQQEPVHDLGAAASTAAVTATAPRREMLLLLLRVLLLLHHRVVHHSAAATHHGLMGRVHHARVVSDGRTAVRVGEVRGLRGGGRRGVPLPPDGDHVGQVGGGAQRSHLPGLKKPVGRGGRPGPRIKPGGMERAHLLALMSCRVRMSSQRIAEKGNFYTELVAALQAGQRSLMPRP